MSSLLNHPHEFEDDYGNMVLKETVICDCGEGNERGIITNNFIHD